MAIAGGLLAALLGCLLCGYFAWRRMGCTSREGDQETNWDAAAVHYDDSQCSCGDEIAGTGS